MWCYVVSLMTKWQRYFLSQWHMQQFSPHWRRVIYPKRLCFFQNHFWHFGRFPFTKRFQKIPVILVGNVYRWRTCSIWHTFHPFPGSLLCSMYSAAKMQKCKNVVVKRNCRVVFARRVLWIQKMMMTFLSWRRLHLYEARSSPKSRFLWKYFAAIYDWWI